MDVRHSRSGSDLSIQIAPQNQPPHQPPDTVISVAPTSEVSVPEAVNIQRANASERAWFVAETAAKAILWQGTYATAGAGITCLLLEAGVPIVPAMLAGSAGISHLKETWKPFINQYGSQLKPYGQHKEKMDIVVRNVDSTLEGALFVVAGDATGRYTQNLEKKYNLTGDDAFGEALKKGGFFGGTSQMYGITHGYDTIHEVGSALLLASVPNVQYDYKPYKIKAADLKRLIPLFDKDNFSKYIGHMWARGFTMLGTWGGACITKIVMGGLPIAKEGALKSIGGGVMRALQGVTKPASAKEARKLVDGVVQLPHALSQLFKGEANNALPWIRALVADLLGTAVSTGVPTYFARSIALAAAKSISENGGEKNIEFLQSLLPYGAGGLAIVGGKLLMKSGVEHNQVLSAATGKDARNYQANSRDRMTNAALNLLAIAVVGGTGYLANFALTMAKDDPENGLRMAQDAVNALVGTLIASYGQAALESMIKPVKGTIDPVNQTFDLATNEGRIPFFNGLLNAVTTWIADVFPVSPYPSPGERPLLAGFSPAPMAAAVATTFARSVENMMTYAAGAGKAKERIDAPQEEESETSERGEEPLQQVDANWFYEPDKGLMGSLASSVKDAGNRLMSGMANNTILQKGTTYAAAGLLLKGVAYATQEIARAYNAPDTSLPTTGNQPADSVLYTFFPIITSMFAIQACKNYLTQAANASDALQTRTMIT